MRSRACIVLCALAIATAAVVSPPARAASLAEAAAAALQPPAADDRPAGLFGTLEFRSDSLELLPQWRRVVADFAVEQPLYEACAADPAWCGSRQLEAWRKVIVAAQGLSRLEQIQLVNSYFNRWPYREDRSIYGVNEYWATPTEFLMQSGDCEDYSIAKFFALRQLGFGSDEVRVVIVMDTIRGIGHAVLAVRLDTDILILDSLSDLILPHDRYRHYIPQYSMNETSRWAHVTTSRRTPLARVSGTSVSQGR